MHAHIVNLSKLHGEVVGFRTAGQQNGLAFRRYQHADEIKHRPEIGQIAHGGGLALAGMRDQQINALRLHARPNARDAAIVFLAGELHNLFAHR